MPPLYTVSLILPAYLAANAQCLEPGAIEGVRGGVHGEHDVYFHAAGAPGHGGEVGRAHPLRQADPGGGHGHAAGRW